MSKFELESVEPPEDAGSETQSRYRYQAELAFHECAVMVVEGGTVERVICEFHEDYIAVRPATHPTLVSVKHLEENQSRWTLRSLCLSGGVLHLFGRWRAASEAATCLLRTNTGLPNGDGKPGALADACDAADEDKLSEWADDLTNIFNDHLAESDECDSAEVKRFLLGLRIEQGLPNRTSIGAKNLVDVMPEVMRSLGEPQENVEAVYEVLVSEIERASRTESSQPVIAMLADPDRFDVNSRLARTLQAKTLTRQRLLNAIDRSRSAPSAPAVKLADLGDRPQARLKLKLVEGGFGPTAINHARNLRIHWEQHRQRWSTGLPAIDDRFNEMRAAVLKAADSAETRARARVSGEAKYGTAMLEELAAALAQVSTALPGREASDLDLLLGCVYELTDECVVWWSDEFEIAEVEV